MTLPLTVWVLTEVIQAQMEAEEMKRVTVNDNKNGKQRQRLCSWGWKNELTSKDKAN